MQEGFQKTVASPVRLDGRGLHSGAPARVVLRPAPAGTGVWFQRMDLDGSAFVPARWDAVEESRLCTRVVNEDGVSVSTIEHLMAALAGLGIYNALIEIDGPEVPILDGSALPFVRAILSAGVRILEEPQTVREILRPVEVEADGASALLLPGEATEISFEIDFPDPAIGRQALTLAICNGAFVGELADSRTFCRLADVEAMRAAGLARGGTLSNAVVVDGARILTPGGLRRADEPVRHKMLDAVGDLALAGAPIIGRYVGRRAGHRLTNRLLRALFADPAASRVRVATGALAARLPGSGICSAEHVRVA